MIRCLKIADFVRRPYEELFSGLLVAYAVISDVTQRVRSSRPKKFRDSLGSVPANKKAPDLSARRFPLKLNRQLSAATATAATAVATTSAAATAAVASATAAITTAAASVATATATSAASTAIAAATARWACFARSRFVHGQRPTFNSLAVELGDRLLRVLLRRHGDEGKAARFPGELVLHEGDFLHRADAREEILQIRLGRVEGKISYV